MAPKGKLDKFFASKDKKKQKDTNPVSKPEEEDEVSREVGIEFGITGEFTGRTVKLTKEGVIETDDELIARQQVIEDKKTWKDKGEAEKEAIEASRALAEKRAKEAEDNKPQLGVYRPGQGAQRRNKEDPVEISEQQFPALGEATKFKSADEFQRSLQKPASSGASSVSTAPSNAFRARASPANAWSSQPSFAAASGATDGAPAGAPGAYRAPGGGGTAYQPPGGGLFKK